jgi:hypothetical protein
MTDRRIISLYTQCSILMVEFYTILYKNYYLINSSVVLISSSGLYINFFYFFLIIKFFFYQHKMDNKKIILIIVIMVEFRFYLQHDTLTPNTFCFVQNYLPSLDLFLFTLFSLLITSFFSCASNEILTLQKTALFR